MSKGKYVVIEGHDGTGKSTQVENIRKKLLEQNIESIEFHEPAGSPIADEIRTILKNGNLERDAITNMLLFTAARHDIWESRAKAAIKAGKWVITARNYYSTLAFQGYGEGLDLDLINTITEKSMDRKYINPDLAIILNLDDEKERFNRINKRGELENPDTFESKDEIFQTKVRKGYLDISKKRHIPIVSANQTIELVTNDIWSYVKKIL